MTKGSRCLITASLRMQLRDYLSHQDLASLPALKRFVQANARHKNGVQDLAQYISYALSVTGPPDFALAHPRRGSSARMPRRSKASLRC